MTLGCGGYGGNITSDNISPRHLLNIKRLAYEITPAARSRERGTRVGQPRPAPGLALPKAPAHRRAGRASTPASLARRIDEFLGSRGYVAPPKALQRRIRRSTPQPDARRPAARRRPAPAADEAASISSAKTTCGRR